MIADIGEIVTLSSLTVSFILMLMLLRKHSYADVPLIHSMKTWLALAILMWIVGELVSLAGDLPIGLVIHMIAMLLFPAIMLFKLKTFLKKVG